MENVVLIVHLILALGLIAVVLLQRSEGGGLGMGGGGGGGAVSGRSAATPMGKQTWVLAGSSVIDRLGGTPPALNQGDAPALPDADALLPPTPAENTPQVPTAD
jgi:preprotein translocase subunit SecG